MCTSHVHGHRNLIVIGSLGSACKIKSAPTEGVKAGRNLLEERVSLQHSELHLLQKTLLRTKDIERPSSLLKHKPNARRRRQSDR